MKSLHNSRWMVIRTSRLSFPTSLKASHVYRPLASYRMLSILNIEPWKRNLGAVSTRCMNLCNVRCSYLEEKGEQILSSFIPHSCVLRICLDTQDVAHLWGYGGHLTNGHINSKISRFQAPLSFVHRCEVWLSIIFSSVYLPRAVPRHLAEWRCPPCAIILWGKVSRTHCISAVQNPLPSLSCPNLTLPPTGEVCLQVILQRLVVVKIAIMLLKC